MLLSWKRTVMLSILFVLCLSQTIVLCEEDTAGLPQSPVQLELKEAREARRAAERRVIELEAAFAKQQEELQEMRRRYATLYMASREQQDELSELQLHIAGLLSEHEDLSGGQALSRVLAALDDLQKQQQELNTALVEFNHYLNSILDILQPSETLRRDIIARLQGLIASAARSVKPLSLVAGRDSRNKRGDETRVLAVNHDLQVVVLDRGADDGIRKGSSWKIVNGGDVMVRLKVVEVRPSISAAIIIDGRLNVIGPGALIERDVD